MHDAVQLGSCDAAWVMHEASIGLAGTCGVVMDSFVGCTYIGARRGLHRAVRCRKSPPAIS